MINMLDAVNDMMFYPNIKNKLRIGKLNVADGVRPFSSSEEFQSNDLQYTDRFIEVQPAKRELLIDTEVYRTTYLSEVLTPGTGAKKKEIPYAQFTWREVFKAMWAEINDKTVFDGFDKADAVAYSEAATYNVGDYVTFTQSGVSHWWKCLTNTAAGEDPTDTPAKWQKTTAEAITTGFAKLIADEITATNLTAESIGAIDATAGVAKGAFLEMFRSMPQVYQKYGIVINCSFTDFDFLTDDLESITKYTRDDVTATDAANYRVLPNTNGRCIVKPATWITGRRLIAGPAKKVNSQWKNQALILGTDLLSDMNQISMKDTELWTLKAGIKFLLGFQIANLEEIRVNDQA
jgi:hypothetical protein